jgi:Tol biopolymer transport system component
LTTACNGLIIAASPEPMPLNTGTRLGSYQILSAIGSGGMGEVYRARDTRLERDVAVKVLPESFAADPDRLARFTREAKTLASLNHPGIAQIYGLEEAGRLHAIVMELVDGQTLADRIAHGPMPLNEALATARGIAEALEAAHGQGVVHRDLKPNNVMLLADGRVKILDFGLAKAMEVSAATSGVDSPTVISPVQANSPTIAGVIMGTTGYMSPEQARGKPVDKRSDIFSFGCVCYEMFTGVRAFTGETVADFIGAVLHKQPDWTRLPAETPQLVRFLLERCLAKDRVNRLQDIGDARVLIEEMREGSLFRNSGALETAPARPRGWLALIPWLLVAALLVVSVWAILKPPSSAQPIVRSMVPLPSGVFLAVRDIAIALSPDGRTLAFAAGAAGKRTQLWTRTLDSLSAQPLVGTDDAITPFWSPDGLTIGFFAGGRLLTIPAAGGPVTTVCPAVDSRGASWGRDGTIVFSPSAFGPLMRVPASGGTPVAITRVDGQESHRWPHFLPGGSKLLYFSNEAKTGGVMLLDLASRTSVRVSADQSAAVFAPPDQLVFVRGGALMAQPFDPATGKLSGDALQITESVEFDPLRFAGYFAVSTNGALAYQPRMALRRLEWIDAGGQSLGQFGEPAAFFFLSVSPDGARVAAVINRPDKKLDLWLSDTTQGLRSKIVEDLGVYSVVWSPDSKRIAYLRGHAPGPQTTQVLTVDGSQEEGALGDVAGWPTDWSPNGALIALTAQRATTRYDIVLSGPPGGAPARPLRATNALEDLGVFSRDNRWLAYFTDESGRPGINVVSVTGGAAPRPIAAGGDGGTIFWADDGTIFFEDPADTRVYGISVRSSGAGLDVGTASPRFGGRSFPGAVLTYTRDGKKLLAAMPVGDDATRSLVLVQNWTRR